MPVASIEPATQKDEGPARLQILALNDFHGYLLGLPRGQKRVGGASAIEAAFEAERAAFDGTTLVAHAGDFVGASPPVSGLLQDEPSMWFLGALSRSGCRPGQTAVVRDAAGLEMAACDLIATFGNHEFDEGVDEALRLVFGGDHVRGPFLGEHYLGSAAVFVSANVVDASSGEPLVPPFAVRRVDGVPVAIIGAVRSATQKSLRPVGQRRGLFLGEARAINGYVKILQDRGIHAFIVLLHEGGSQAPYPGPTRADAGKVSGRIASLVAALDPDVDVVISGHTHEFTNDLLPTAGNTEALVVQSQPYGQAYADVELVLDRRTGDVASKSAQIKRVATVAGGDGEDGPVRKLVRQAEAAVAPLVSRVVGRLEAAVTRRSTSAGESVLGDLVADAFAQALGADAALVSPGGLRADLAAADVTYGDVLTTLPFGNTVVSIELTGEQLLAVLEQQFRPSGSVILQVSGLSYEWSEESASGRHVHNLRVRGAPLEARRAYRVATADYLADGGGGFSLLSVGVNRETGPLDAEALAAYLEAAGGPVRPPSGGRIRKLAQSWK